MCGRYTITADADELIESFDVPGLTFEHHPRHNVAPGQDAPVVAVDRRGRRMGLLRWGLVPAWSAPGRAGSINARAESVRSKTSFREAFRTRRCLVPADGFYEWRRAGGTRTPHWFHQAEGGLFAFAGIREGRAFAILTTAANEDVSAVHDRMPLLVVRAQWPLWLERDTALDALDRILLPAPPGTLVSHPVSPRVNRSDQDDPSLIERV